MAKWSTKVRRGPRSALGYFSWLFWLVGLVLLLRSSGRGRCSSEPATVIVVACLPPVWSCLEFFFHPQDLVAIGFALAAMACALRSQRIGAGVPIALAVLTQQFTLLAALPLLIVANLALAGRYSSRLALFWPHDHF
jgi:hypothetical protein